MKRIRLMKMHKKHNKSDSPKKEKILMKSDGHITEDRRIPEGAIHCWERQHHGRVEMFDHHQA
jgi:hypothetical protein